MIIDDSRAVIVFLKPPEIGKVKTRLAADIGNDNAFAIYEKLLQHTIHVLNGVNSFRYIYIANSASLDIALPPRSYEAKLQEGNDLGEKMKNAFEHAFDDGKTEVLIIGSDNIQITPRLIEEAFDALLSNDLVIGPANDGGYYLLGMNESLPSLFKDIPWSTENVYERTMKKADELDLKVKKLMKLADIDHWSDVEVSGWQSAINKYGRNK